MAEKAPCRWATETWDCSHPLVRHLVGSSGCWMKSLPWISPATCHGCPCHEPAEPAKPVFDPAIAERITMTDIDAALHLRALLQELKTTWLRLAGLHIEITEIDDSPVTATPYTEEEEPNDA